MNNANKTTKGRIIESMYHLVAEKGYDKASINQICKDVGITKPSVYYYFKSKEDIFLAVLNDLYPLVGFTREVRFEQLNDAKVYRKKLMDLGLSLIDSYRDDKERRMVLAELSIQSERIPSVWNYKARLDQANIEAWEVILKRGIEIRALDPQLDIKLRSQTLFVITAGISSSIAYRDEVDAKAIWIDAIDHLFFSDALER